MSKHAEYKQLEWPNYRPRTQPSDRSPAQFSKTVNNGKYNSRKLVDMETALKRLDTEITSLNRKYYTKYVLTTGGIGRNGRPVSRVDDPGAAVYFKLYENDVVLACDKWDRPADNIVAIAKHIGSLRGQNRWGVGSTKQAFAGYMALPAPMSGGSDWRSTLNFKFDENPSREDINKRFKSMAKQHHSDKGGKDANMAYLIEARDAALTATPQ